ncbi:MAG: hypothetical protein LBT41_04240 [Candidatus Methanoplasma sp.]|jgi:tRNA A58 N-methylase Trm61|nr:hypothetical protein [Candidatus Methanoplasma sp.]
MATESFYDLLVIDTPEKWRAIEKAYAIYKERGHLKPDPEIMKKLAEDEEYFKDPKNWPNVK